MMKIATGGHPDLKMVNPATAAIDIGSTMHMAAVNPDACDMPVRAFGTFTQDLHDLADWFDACGVTSVAMESTGVYWIPAFEVLEARGFHVILVNARYAKNVPGRKTDVSDAGWLRQLHSYGLLRGSFRPAAEIATLRAYLRQRERLVEYAAAHIQHMQKALMKMNLQLHHVVSDITGATGMRIIRAIVVGERDPEVLAAFRDIRCHSSIEVIKAALVGNDRAQHIFALTQSLELYDVYQAKIEDCDRKLEAAVAALTVKAHGDISALPKARTKRKQVNAPSFDVRAALYGVLSTDLAQAALTPTARRLQTMPGVGPMTALAVEAFAPAMETFKCGRDFAAWLGLVPRQMSSGGKERLGRVSKAGQSDIRRLLIIGAMSRLNWMVLKSIREGSWLDRLRARKPKMLVAIALANKMARMVWAMLTHQQDYKDPIPAGAP